MARRVLHDHFFKLAKAEGYLARSAYKLIEINQKRRLIRPGEVVLDLGCAPGSWLQVAADLVGPRGVVVGIDLTPVDHRFPEHVRVLRGDVFSTPPEEYARAAGRRPRGGGRGGQPGVFDVVLSDMAPSTSGHGDDLLSVRLCLRVLEILPGLLRPGGVVCMKVLEGSGAPELIAEAKRQFAECGTTKPAASRAISREMFIVGTGYTPRGATPRADPRLAVPAAPKPRAGWSDAPAPPVDVRAATRSGPPPSPPPFMPRAESAPAPSAGPSRRIDLSGPAPADPRTPAPTEPRPPTAPASNAKARASGRARPRRNDAAEGPP